MHCLTHLTFAMLKAPTDDPVDWDDKVVNADPGVGFEEGGNPPSKSATALAGLVGAGEKFAKLAKPIWLGAGAGVGAGTDGKE